MHSRSIRHWTAPLPLPPSRVPKIATFFKQLERCTFGSPYLLTTTKRSLQVVSSQFVSFKYLFAFVYDLTQDLYIPFINLKPFPVIIADSTGVRHILQFSMRSPRILLVIKTVQYVVIYRYCVIGAQHAAQTSSPQSLDLSFLAGLNADLYHSIGHSLGILNDNHGTFPLKSIFACCNR